MALNVFSRVVQEGSTEKVTFEKTQGRATLESEKRASGEGNSKGEGPGAGVAPPGTANGARRGPSEGRAVGAEL